MPSPRLNREALAWLVVVLILGLTAFFGWQALQNAKPQAENGGRPARPPAAVVTQPVTQRTIAESLTVTGTLRAVRRAEVASRESAAVESLLVKEGDLLNSGDPIARLDPRRLRSLTQEATAALTSAKADLSQRQAELDRATTNQKMMTRLWTDRAVSESEYLDSLREEKVAVARSEAAAEMIEAARQRLELLELRKADLEIRAPFDGRVVARHTEQGQWLAEGSPVVTLVSTGEAEAWLELPERHAQVLRDTSPDSVEIFVTGITEPVRADRFSVIPEVDGRSRRFIVIAHLPDPENTLTVGASVTAKVPLGIPTNRLTVPSDAILTGFSGPYLFTLQNSPDGPPTAKRVPVEVLFQDAGETILTSDDLNADDLVIVDGNERLRPDSPVAPTAR